MTINELISACVDSRENLLLTREALEKAEKKFNAAYERLRSHIHNSFAKYLADRPEIQSEDFIVWVAHKGIKSSDPYVQIILGKDQESLRNVTVKFRDFVGIHRPLEIEVLRFFTPIESVVTKQGSYYGNANGYKKV